MNLKDLKTGWRVQTRNGDTYVVLRDCETVEYGHQDSYKKCFCPVCSKEMEVMNNGTIN